MLFEVDAGFADEEWSEPVRYRFVRAEGGLLAMELQQVDSEPFVLSESVVERVSAYTEPKT